MEKQLVYRHVYTYNELKQIRRDLTINFKSERKKLSGLEVIPCVDFGGTIVEEVIPYY
jgi:hypothetical protein